MRYTSFDHPAVDLLERFALDRCSEDELELVEEHILACESCVCAVEALEVELAAAKLALEQIMQAQNAVVEPERKAAWWRSWFSVPNLSWAGAGLAACALCLFTFVPAHVALQAQRGIESTLIVPEWRHAVLTLRDEGLQDGPVRAELVNENGTVLWHGTARSISGAVHVDLPRLMSAGRYYARLYTPAEHELLSEFPFQVKFQF
jgi:hypothetical protein